MQADNIQIAQLGIELDIIPFAFRCGFVIFLFVIVFMMKEDDKKGVGKIND